MWFNLENLLSLALKICETVCLRQFNHSSRWRYLFFFLIGVEGLALISHNIFAVLVDIVGIDIRGVFRNQSNI